MSLLLPDSGLLFWMLLSFGIVFFIVAKWGFPVITRMVEERKEYITKSLQAADETNRRLAEVKVQSEAMLEETRSRQLSILRETSQTKERILADAKEAAQRETQKMLQETQKQIRLEHEAALTEIRSQVAILAVDIAEKILRNKLKEKDCQMDLLNRMIDEAQRENLAN
ncbi:MAG: F0F1 ATP synthase subunit B [Bacteroidales bacterium]|nr:F0F1 ATP synthase subunit B [Bacteroidales bacterium]MCL2132740.1 F0F1 ATP synthase subunit B [Bacteroidales bacterium]